MGMGEPLLNMKNLIPALEIMLDDLGFGLSKRRVTVSTSGVVFLASVRRYIASSNANRGRVTVEYVLLDHINDGTEHAHELAELMKDTPCKINLIPFNPYPGSTVTTRKTRGDDIDAACGQLVGDVIDRTKRTAIAKAAKGESIDIKAL